MRKRHNKILFLSTLISLSIHISAVVFIQRHSIWFYPKNPQLASAPCPYLEMIEKREKDEILKAAFLPGSSGIAEKSNSPRREKESAALAQKFVSKMEEDTAELAILFQQNLPFPTQELLSFHPLPIFSFPMEERISLFDHLSKDLILPTPPIAALPSFTPAPLPSFPPVLKTEAPAVQQEASAPEIIYSEPLLNSSALREAPDVPKAPLTLLPVTMPRLPTLAELQTASYSDAFEAELVFLPKENDEGVVFALTLIPRMDLDLPKMTQNYTFLIDRSNSIQRDRLHAVKSAVYKALEELMPDDTFNIIVFDSKLEKLSPRPISACPQSLMLAENFLDKITLGSFFSQANLYRPLLMTVPGEVQNNEVHTAILFTDSEALAKKNDQKSLLHDWTRYNNGRVSLYAIGLKGDHHLGTLDAAAAFNRGKLSQSPTKRGLKRKILKLLKTIQKPIAKNMSCHAISRTPKAKIEIYPHSTSAQHLYQDQPYVILGESNTMDDFILFVQGRAKNQWFNIKKTISFLSAKKGTQSLRGEWALQRSYKLYEQYVNDENQAHLTEARSLLKPFDYEIAFE